MSDYICWFCNPEVDPLEAQQRLDFMRSVNGNLRKYTKFNSNILTCAVCRSTAYENKNTKRITHYMERTGRHVRERKVLQLQDRSLENREE